MSNSTERSNYVSTPYLKTSLHTIWYSLQHLKNWISKSYVVIQFTVIFYQSNVFKQNSFEGS